MKGETHLAGKPYEKSGDSRRDVEALPVVRHTPKPVDPREPAQASWPRGWNFGNVVFVLYLAAVLVVLLVTALTTD